MESRVRMTGLLGTYKCDSCNQSNTFSEKIPNEKVRNFSCPHFKLLVMFINSNGLKFHIKTYCNQCYKEYSSDLKLGGLDANHQLITDDTYISFCCGNKIEVILNLVKDYVDTNSSNYNNAALFNSNNNRNNSSNNYNNFNNNNNNLNNNNFNNNSYSFNPMMSNFMNMNMMNPNYQLFSQMFLMNMNNNNNFMNNFNNQNNNINNFNNKNNSNNNNNFNNNINNNKNYKYNNISNTKFDSSNIMEFGKKKKLVTFLDESTNKNYKIFTSPDLKIKNVLNDLLNQNPEINYNNSVLAINGNNINPESSISSCNLNENSIIVIKN
jgi:hypothetical protein